MSTKPLISVNVPTSEGQGAEGIHSSVMAYPSHSQYPLNAISADDNPDTKGYVSNTNPPPAGSGTGEKNQDQNGGSVAAGRPLHVTPSEQKHSVLEHACTIDTSRFWAVLIGINGYPGADALRGCVSDALAMEDFLINDLVVPKDRIQRLLGPSRDDHFQFMPASSIPTRHNIVETLWGLVDNPNILHGDNIIIYYAGHGTRYETLAGGHLHSLEALCPIDRGTHDADGALISDICDREINAILEQISNAKGHRITVILDCCHSASATRSPLSAIEKERSIRPIRNLSIEDLLKTTDKHLKRVPGIHSVLEEGWQPNMDSHVAFAACSMVERALELQGQKGTRGVFTQALLSALRYGTLGADASYLDLLDEIEVQWRHSKVQAPLVAGTHKTASLWFKD
ncbi:caspase domain-containing protein [Armillaria borealis]|uniref:Caspase domain-containing protein n=1 Tax=Armillaria borealis TaxID=47425 RepID=A0AA39IV60_9AGAR|nr:caspase domain-containing protein [Armillaria borealis]